MAKNPTLCWDCSKACAGCSWSQEFIPVEGWDATPTKLYTKNTALADTYIVNACPLFERDAFMAGQKWADRTNTIIRRKKTVKL